MSEKTNTDPRTIPIGEWSTLPLPEGREGWQMSLFKVEV